MGVVLVETPPAIVENPSGQMGDFFDAMAPKFSIHMPQFTDRILTRELGVAIRGKPIVQAIGNGPQQRQGQIPAVSPGI
jgi:hypothetical protein